MFLARQALVRLSIGLVSLSLYESILSVWRWQRYALGRRELKRLAIDGEILFMLYIDHPTFIRLGGGYNFVRSHDPRQNDHVTIRRRGIQLPRHWRRYHPIQDVHSNSTRRHQEPVYR